jgi:hypothetical protein
LAVRIWAAALHAWPVFLAAALARESGYSLLFGDGLSLLNANAPGQNRGGTISALYLVAYLMQGLIALVL